MRRTTGARLRKKRGGEGRDALKNERCPRVVKAFCVALCLGVALFAVNVGMGWPVGTPTSHAAQAADADGTTPDGLALDAPDAQRSAQAQPRAGKGGTQGVQGEEQNEVTAPIVRSIRIRGNEQVSAETIFAAIQATRVGEPFSKENVMADFQTIYSLGYFTPDITADVAPDGDGVSVIFQLTEFLVTEIQVSASDALEGLVDTQQVSDSFSLQPGDVVDSAKLNRDLVSLTDFVWAEFGVLVHPDSPSITQDGIIKINLLPIRVRQIGVEGNEKTNDNVILRELDVKPGDVVSRDEITDDARSVLHLGFFNEVVPQFRDVPAEAVKSGEAANTIDLVFKVTERKTGSATFGAGWSSEGLMGQISIADTNFLGRGEEVELSAEFGEDRATYNLGFTEPYLTTSGTSFEINVYNEREQYDQENEETNKTYTLEDRTTGGNVTLGHPLSDYTRAYATLRIDGSTVTNLDENMKVPGDSGTTRSLTLSTSTDTSDHPYFPTTGYRTDFAAEFAGGFLGGDHDFNKYQAEMVKYLRVGSADQSLAFRLRGGMASDTLPFQERFRVGGANTVRGYGYGAVSGTQMVVGNAEYRFDITDGIQGVVFSDVGSAWDSSDAPNWEEMKKSAGLGVRLDTPIGILRIDYGWGQEGGKASFSLGPSF